MCVIASNLAGKIHKNIFVGHSMMIDLCVSVIKEFRKEKEDVIESDVNVEKADEIMHNINLSLTDLEPKIYQLKPFVGI